MKTIKGKVWRFGSDINTDDIIPARYLHTTDARELASHCMEHARPGFSDMVRPGDIIVAGKNFGCGSSREHAPIAIKGLGVSCVIASSFARIFYRNCFNIGLLVYATGCAEKISEGDELEVDTAGGEIKNITKNELYKVDPVPEFMQKLIDGGGLMEYAKKINNG